MFLYLNQIFGTRSFILIVQYCCHFEIIAFIFFSFGKSKVKNLECLAMVDGFGSAAAESANTSQLLNWVSEKLHGRD